MIAKQFLLSAARDQKALTSSKLQFIDATVKSELFVHKGNLTDYKDTGSTCSFDIIITSPEGFLLVLCTNKIPIIDVQNQSKPFIRR